MTSPGKRRVHGFSIAIALAIGTGASAAAPASRDTMPDTWAATDALGRTLIGHETAGRPRPGKYVGAFYFLWMGQHGTDGPFDITKLLAQDPDAMTRPSSPLWGPQNKFHFWGEPLFGYYQSDDAWVLQKHAQMLNDAGVDVVIFDVTNQVTYTNVYMKLCEVWSQLRQRGQRTPQIAFLTPFWDPARVASQLYGDLYKPQRYPELWFRWKGKPLMLADPAKVAPELRDVFTFRKPQPDYVQGPTGPDQWGWLEIYPQHAFRNREGTIEEVAVGVAHNSKGGGACAFSEQNTFGRSRHGGKTDPRPNAVLHGLNFAEQWERALELDPEFVFVTGWNEWIAMRLPEFAGVREPVMFVDQYTQEYSRDVEPMKGGHGDNYYYQMVNYIRRFKGVRPPPDVSGTADIRIDGEFTDWTDVRPKYLDDAGDTMHRDHPGYEKAGRYTNTSGRNDLIVLKAAFNRTHVFFYARTAAPLTPQTDTRWMLLFIDADADPKTGWEGYDLLVNRSRSEDGSCSLERAVGGQWQRADSVPLRASGSELEIAVPRSALPAADWPRFRFKWADNIQRTDDVMEFTVNGDVAPNARFTYRFEQASGVPHRR